MRARHAFNTTLGVSFQYRLALDFRNLAVLVLLYSILSVICALSAPETLSVISPSSTMNITVPHLKLFAPVKLRWGSTHILRPKERHLNDLYIHHASQPLRGLERYHQHRNVHSAPEIFAIVRRKAIHTVPCPRSAGSKTRRAASIVGNDKGDSARILHPQRLMNHFYFSSVEKHCPALQLRPIHHNFLLAVIWHAIDKLLSYAIDGIIAMGGKQSQSDGSLVIGRGAAVAEGEVPHVLIFLTSAVYTNADSRHGNHGIDCEQPRE